MELYDVMRTTFAARDYTGDPLPDEVLHEILENARFAPSGGNRQGNRVIVVRDPETRDQLAKLAEPAAKRLRRSDQGRRKSLECGYPHRGHGGRHREHAGARGAG